MLVSEILTESSKFTKLRRYVHKLASSDERSDMGIAIVTPMNPLGGSSSQEEYDSLSDHEKQEWRSRNNQLMDMGERILKSMHKVYTKQKGVFDGQTERSFIIYDMSRQETIDMSKRWNQTAAIYISIEPTAIDGENMMTVEMIDTSTSLSDGIAISTVSNIFKASDSIQDYFSQVGPNKWVIPFFDSEEEAIAFLKKRHGADIDVGELPRTKSGKKKGQVLELDTLMYMDGAGKLNKLKQAA